MAQLISLLMLCAALATVFGSASVESEARESSPAIQLLHRWGVVVESVRQTAGGFAVDFRYRVVDPDKAAPLFMRNKTPYMLDQASGKAVSVASGAVVGPLRSSQPPVAGHIYVILFSNPGKLIKPGNKVSVAIGDFKAENLIVE